MNKNELKEQFSIDCTELDTNGKLVVKGTPMDIINWISEKFHLSDVSKPLAWDKVDQWTDDIPPKISMFKKQA